MNECGNCHRPTDLFLCLDCAAEVAGHCTDLPWLHQQLGIVATRQTRRGISSPIGSGTNDSSQLPFHDKASKLQERMHVTLFHWCAEVSVRRSIALPARSSITAYAAWLAHNMAAITWLPDAAACHHDIEQLAIAAERLVDRPTPPVYRGPCPTVLGRRHGVPVRCGTPLYAPRTFDDGGWTVGADRITCPHCGVEHDVRRLEQQLLADMAHYLMSRTQIFQVLHDLGEPISPNTFKQWRRRGRLQPRGWLHDGRIVTARTDHNDPPVFEFGEVRALQARSAEIRAQREHRAGA
jgi:hypothetical protein